MSVAQEIKQRLDLVNIVSDYVKLEKAGRYLKGFCPFHTEKNPSFFVFPERQSWRCFGCGASGDIFSFMMEKEGIDFKAALQALADRAGISLPQKKAEGERWGKLYRINEAAAKYYQRLLMSSPAAEAAREYLKERGVGARAVEEFELGFSLDSWEGLRQELERKGYAADELLAAGLLTEKEGRNFDRFRGKLMFPIRDIKGRVVGFGARALEKDSRPKYLNSPQTQIFDKGSILYGIDKASEEIRKQKKVIIVEGYMDVIAAHEHGFRHVVGSMGTSLTPRQLALLKNLTTSFYLSLDPDAAGDIASLRSIELCRQTFSHEACALRNLHQVWKNLQGGTSELEAELRLIPLPQGKDPDKLIRESSKEWSRLIDKALPLMEHAFTRARDKFDLKSPRGKSQAAENLLPLIAELSEVEREFYLNKLSHLVGLSERTLLGIAQRLKGTQAERHPGESEKPSRSVTLGDSLEEYCLHLLLCYPELRDRGNWLSPEEFEHSENREIFAFWKKSSNPQAIRENLPAELQEHLERLLNKNFPEQLGREKLKQAFSETLRRLKKRNLRARLIFEGKAALEGGEDVEQSVKRLASLQKQIAALSLGESQENKE